MNSCSSDEEVTNLIEESKTTLFNEVQIEEVENNSVYSDYEVDALFLADGIASEVFIGGSGSDTNNQIEPGVLTAGEWNDLENWDFWNDLVKRQDFSQGVDKWSLADVKRYSFQVFDNQNSFVANAEISLLKNQIEVWKTKTDNTGKATLWSNTNLEELSAIVSIKGNEESITQVKEYEEGVNIVNFNSTVTNAKKMDIYFAVDATGSMGDEINYLKAELSNVIESLKAENLSLEMRFGSVFYRDEGDEYVTRDLGFTNDETNLVSFIKEQSASGGGDFPEAVAEALDVAITQNVWDETASSRILFLLLDAPPHYTQESVAKLENSLLKASEEGIKVIPITASGIDKSTEYLMRSFAILTNGTYVFITDDSGIGNSHIEPTIGNYEVQKLNELLINLVGSYIP